MGAPPDRIMIVENDPKINDLIGRQALQSIGYQVQIVENATAAIPQALQFQPAAVMIDLNVPGLSGKDLLVALSSQRINVPAIVIARKGMEADIIQAFRLGAADYLLWPARDAEVVAVVERALRQVRERRERDVLTRQLQQTNQELQTRVRDLTSIVNTAKAVTPLADPYTLYERTLDGLMHTTGADTGWLMMRTDPDKDFTLAASRKLPSDIGARLNQPWDDGISQMTALSGETISMYGEMIKRLQIARLGGAVLAVPVKVQKQVLGMLVAMRSAPRPFSAVEQEMLEAIADFTSIALINLRAFRTLEDRARLLQQSADTGQTQAKRDHEALQRIVHTLQPPLEIIRSSLDILIEGRKGKLPSEQRQILVAAYEKIRLMGDIVERADVSHSPVSKSFTVYNLNNLARQSLTRYNRLAAQKGVSLIGNLCSQPVYVWADSTQIAQVIDALLGAAMQVSPRGAKISLSTGLDTSNQAHVVVQDGRSLDSHQVQHLFDRLPARSQSMSGSPDFSQLKDWITASGGKIWAESKPGQGTSIHFTLLPPREKPAST